MKYDTQPDHVGDEKSSAIIHTGMTSEVKYFFAGSHLQDR